MNNHIHRSNQLSICFRQVCEPCLVFPERIMCSRKASGKYVIQSENSSTYRRRDVAHRIPSLAPSIPQDTTYVSYRQKTSVDLTSQKQERSTDTSNNTY